MDKFPVGAAAGRDIIGPQIGLNPDADRDEDAAGPGSGRVCGQ